VVHLYSVGLKDASRSKSLLTEATPGWEPIFEHNGETLAEMEHDKKVNGKKEMAPDVAN
jgi:hypothetical protein